MERVLFWAFVALGLVSRVVTNETSSSCPVGPGRESHEVVRNDSSFWQYQTYKSSPLQPPELEITTNGQPLAPGLIFITPSNFRTTPAAKDVAPVIMTDAGQLVWSAPAFNSTNLRVAELDGKPVISYWSGLSTEGANVGHGYGNITILDTSYNEVVTVFPKIGVVTPNDEEFPCEADFHESHITSRGTLIYSVYNATRADLSSINGSADGWVFDSVIIEVEPRTSEILFRWSSLEHVPVSSSKAPLRGLGANQSFPFDYFHVNSAVEVGEDAFLINARHTFGIYLVDRKSGTIIWTLEGDTGGDFAPLPPGGHFAWQHHARPHNVTATSMTLTMFNNFNSAYDNGTNPTNGLSYHLSYPSYGRKSATLLTTWADPPNSRPFFALSQGSTEVLPNGNTLLGYGQLPVGREYGPGTGNNTDVRWQGRFGQDSLVQGYRVFKQKWKATPKGTKPSLVVKRSSGGYGGCGKAYVSWNGATSVKAWKVFEGDSKDKLKYTGTVPYRGFETEFVVGGRVVQVAAVTKDGREFKSKVVRSD